MSEKWSEWTSHEELWLACISLAVKYGAACGAICGTFFQPVVLTAVGAICGAIGGCVAGLVATTVSGPLGWGIAGAVGGAAAGLITFIIPGWTDAIAAVLAVAVPALIGGVLGAEVAYGVHRDSSRLPGVTRLAATLHSTDPPNPSSE